jgi:hypothetical protein
MRRRTAALALAISLAAAGSAVAQTAERLPAAAPGPFETWHASLPTTRPGARAAGQLFTAPKNRKRQALIGGAIGAAVGVLACTTISTLSNDSADGGLSFCPLDSNLLIGGAGFVVGAVIGWSL